MSIFFNSATCLVAVMLFTWGFIALAALIAAPIYFLIGRWADKRVERDLRRAEKICFACGKKK